MYQHVFGATTISDFDTQAEVRLYEPAVHIIVFHRTPVDRQDRLPDLCKVMLFNVSRDVDCWTNIGH